MARGRANACNVEKVRGNDQADCPKEKKGLAPINAVSIQHRLARQEDGGKV